METKTLVSVEDYLHTSFDGPDCEYVDGDIVERNWGDSLHSWVQGWIFQLLIEQTRDSRAKVRIELRVRTRETRFRVHDIAVWRASDEISRRFATTPPFLAVEILSPDDRMSRVASKIQEYFQWGVEWVWIIDPEERIGLVYSRQNPLGESVSVLRTENPNISIPLETALNPQD